MAETDGIRAGRVWVFAQVEPCKTFSFRFQQGHPFVNCAKRKCLHVYYYFMDRDFGLIHVMVQSWFPMRMQVFVNGHKLSASPIGWPQSTGQGCWIATHDRSIRWWGRCSGGFALRWSVT